MRWNVNAAWGGRRSQKALEQMKARGKRNSTPCVICLTPIDYGLEYPDPQSCSVQHLKSRHHHPELTWDPLNWAPAHLCCNQSAGTGDSLDIGPSAW